MTICHSSHVLIVFVFFWPYVIVTCPEKMTILITLGCPNKPVDDLDCGFLCEGFSAAEANVSLEMETANIN